MRITGGRFRGRRLAVPQKGVRPTTDRTREAIFNMVAARLELDGARVLDLFAGSGALGFEALSRGADHVEFIERSGGALRVIRSNAEDLDVTDQCAIVRGEAVRHLEQATRPYDLILADPPYDFEEVARLPDLAVKALSTDGLFILEHRAEQAFTDHASLALSRSYGQTRVSIFHK